MLSKPKSPYLPFGDQQKAPWYGKDILSVKQFSRADLEYIFEVAHEMRIMVERIGTFDLLKGKILANVFYEPSTRTASSFMAAMAKARSPPAPVCAQRLSKSLCRRPTMGPFTFTIRSCHS